MIPFNMTDGILTKQRVVTSVCKHYWMREIGCETVGLWKYMIGTRLEEIMPKYQEIALAQSEMGSIWETQNISKKHEGEFQTSGNESGQVSNSKNSTIAGTNSKDGILSGKDGTTSAETGEIDSSHNASNNRNDDKTITTNYGKVTTDKNTEWSDLHKEDNQTQSSNGTENTKSNQTTWHDMQNETNGNTTGKQGDKFSDTPQNGLTAVEEGMYLTNARIVDNEGTTHGTASEHFNDSVNNNSNSDTTLSSTAQVTSTQNEGKNVDGIVTNSGNDTVTDRLTGTEEKTDTGKESSSKNGTINFDTSRTTEETGKHNETVNETGSTTDSKNKSESGTDGYVDSWSGFQGDKVKILADYNEMYVNVYQMIIGEVAGLFMTIF